MRNINVYIYEFKVSSIYRRRMAVWSEFYALIQYRVAKVREQQSGCRVAFSCQPKHLAYKNTNNAKNNKGLIEATRKNQQIEQKQKSTTKWRQVLLGMQQFSGTSCQCLIWAVVVVRVELRALASADDVEISNKLFSHAKRFSMFLLTATRRY